MVVKDDPILDLREAEIDDISFGASFARLNTCNKPEEDPFPEVQGNLDQYTAQKFKEALSDGGRQLQTEIEASLQPQVQNVLRKYLS